MKACFVVYKYSVPLGDACCYPLGFMYVAALYKQKGFEIKVLNYNLWEYDFKEEIKGQDIVAFTGFEEFKDLIIRDALVCKEAGIKTILGGALATFRPDLVVGHVDKLCIGEHSETSKIDVLPLPLYEEFGIEEYHKRHDARYMGILTSFGCPYSCTFCSQVCSYKRRPLQGVLDEVDLYIKKYNTELIVFNDNTININKKYVSDLCNGLTSRNVAWGASIRCDNFDEDLARLFKNSGCSYLVVGIESFNQKKLDYVNKQLKVSDIYKTLDLLYKYKIDYHGNILVGFEYETYDDIAYEVSLIPEGSNIFPMLVQHFIGTQHGKVRRISSTQEEYLNTCFSNYISSTGRYCLRTGDKNI